MRRRYSLISILFACASIAAPSGNAVAQLGSSLGATLGTAGVGIWWRATAAPARWDAALPALQRAIRWTDIGNGIETAELDLQVGGIPVGVHTILVRFDPAGLRAGLELRTDQSRVRGSWTVDSAGSDIILAVNAGQFAEAGPWGWILRGRRELAGPGRGPLAVGVAFDAAGALHWLDGVALGRARASRGHTFETGFQSYPRLLIDGGVPLAVRSGRAIDRGHIDARLALGQLRDGRIVLALTRFGARESAMSRIPIGLTVPAMAALMGALGSANAVMLDGGLSAQLMLRPANSNPLYWRGARKVPVALVFRRR